MWILVLASENRQCVFQRSAPSSLYSVVCGGVSALWCDSGVCDTCAGVHRSRSVVRTGDEAAATRAERQESLRRDDGLGAVGAGGRGGADRRTGAERRERGGWSLARPPITILQWTVLR